MSTIYELVTLEFQNEHDLEHDLEHKTKFSSPKIFDAGGDLSKRWYVYFSYRSPKTGKLKRIKNIYGKANRHKTKEARYTILNLYKKRLLKLLNDGYNPFEDNTELHQQKLAIHSQGNNGTSQNQLKVETKSSIQQKPEQNYKISIDVKQSLTIREAFEKCDTIKNKYR